MALRRLSGRALDDIEHLRMFLTDGFQQMTTMVFKVPDKLLGLLIGSIEGFLLFEYLRFDAGDIAADHVHGQQY